MVERLGAILWSWWWVVVSGSRNGGSCINIISSESLDVGMFLPPHYTPSFGCIRCSSDGWALVLASDSQVCKQCGGRSSHKPSASHLLWSGIAAGWLGWDYAWQGRPIPWVEPKLTAYLLATWNCTFSGQLLSCLDGKGLDFVLTVVGSNFPWKETYEEVVLAVAPVFPERKSTWLEGRVNILFPKTG